MIRLLICVMLFTNTSWSAVRENHQDDDIFSTLSKPHQFAVADIKATDLHRLKKLEQLSFDTKQTMKTRWSAFMVLTTISGNRALPSIKKALMSPTWYMRSAGLEAIHKLNPQSAKRWAFQKLYRDPALMVRMKGLEILKLSMDEKVTELFWKKMFSSDSFHQQQGLWIRKGLAQALLQKPRKQDLSQWIKLLHEKESAINKIAMLALTQIIKKDDSVSLSDIGSLRKQFPLARSL